jgi:hypothetical protein
MVVKPKTKAKVKSKADQYDSKLLPPAGKQTPADFMPKSYDKRFKPVKGGGVNNFGPNSMRGVPLSKQIQDDIKSGKINKDGSWKGPLKNGGKMKKAQSGYSMSNKFTVPQPAKDGSAESNKFKIPSRNKIVIPKKRAKSGGSFPDLNKDGKVTKADILKGRGVIAKKGAKVAKMAKCKYGCK